MGRTSIQASDELADELHSRKARGESYEDVIRRLLDVPGKYRVDCHECGFDGGVYGYDGDAKPSHCPNCGCAIAESQAMVVRVNSSLHDSL